MKRLTQFSIRSLLVLTLAFALGCWWWQLPDATARRFVANPQAFVELERGISGPVEIYAARILQENDRPLQPHPRTFWDAVAGRRTFTRGSFHFMIERGKITQGPLDLRMFVCPTTYPPETSNRPTTRQPAMADQKQS